MALVGKVLGRSAGLLTRSFSASASLHGKVAVVLSGCGVFDGSEIHEASACLMHLSRRGQEVAMFAPDIPQMHIVNHCTTEPAPGETRNVLVESARIARGSISSLSSLSASDYDAVIFPGGYGAAKNLCSFAVDGEGMTVNEDVVRVLKEFHQAGKPIGLCCISPVLAAKVFPGVEVTVGSDQDPTAQAINAMGGKHIAKDVTEAHVDERNKVASAPAYMCEAPLHQIFDGIGNMIAAVVRLAK